MLKHVIHSFLPEITAIESRTRQFLRKNAIEGLFSREMTENRENRLWLPALCLLAAKTAKGTNSKVVQLAGILHVLDYASCLHWSLPDNTGQQDAKKDIQYPILVGDLLYSRVYMDICRFELQQYLSPLASLISAIHEELVMRDLKKMENISHLPHEIKIFALMTESACYLGAHSAAGNTVITEKLREFGYHLGMVRAVWDIDTDIEPYLHNWHKCWELLGFLPAGMERDMLQQILYFMGNKWQLEKPVLLKGAI